MGSGATEHNTTQARMCPAEILQLRISYLPPTRSHTLPQLLSVIFFFLSYLSLSFGLPFPPSFLPLFVYLSPCSFSLFLISISKHNFSQSGHHLYEQAFGGQMKSGSPIGCSLWRSTAFLFKFPIFHQTESSLLYSQQSLTSI
jgi:hypothetical protein